MKRTTENKRTPEEITAAIVEFFKENDDVFTDCIEELDNYNGCLGDNKYYLMGDLDELFDGEEPSRILNMAFFGHDAETYTTDAHGRREYGAFNPNREYFTFNGYGNLISADYKDYTAQIDRYAVEDMSANRVYINAIEDDETLAALFDELEEAQANEE